VPVPSTSAGACAIDRVETEQMLRAADEAEAMFRATVAVNVARIRTLRGIAQSKLVEGFPSVQPGASARATAYKIENARTAFTTHRLAMLAVRLGVSVSDLCLPPTTKTELTTVDTLAEEILGAPVLRAVGSPTRGSRHPDVLEQLRNANKRVRFLEAKLAAAGKAEANKVKALAVVKKRERELDQERSRRLKAERRADEQATAVRDLQRAAKEAAAERKRLVQQVHELERRLLKFKSD
jgi:hypothetical protein